MRLLVIANNRAGGDDDAWRDALAILQDGADVDLAPATVDLDELCALIDRADGRLPVVAGGDGSIHALVAAADRLGRLGGVSRDPFEFAIVPLGTGNDLARTLGIPLDPVDAARVVLADHRRDLDVLVDDTGGVVVNVVHLGIGAEAGRLAHQWKRRLGRWAYPAGALVAGMRARGWHIRLNVDGADMVVDGTRPVLMVALGNGATFGGGAPVAPQATPEDGQVDVIVSFATGRLARIGFAVALILGRHPQRADVVLRRANTVTIDAGRETVAVNADGELSTVTGTRTWTVRQHAARVIVPPR